MQLSNVPSAFLQLTPLSYTLLQLSLAHKLTLFSALKNATVSSIHRSHTVIQSLKKNLRVHCCHLQYKLHSSLDFKCQAHNAV